MYPHVNVEAEETARVRLDRRGDSVEGDGHARLAGAEHQVSRDDSSQRSALCNANRVEREVGRGVQVEVVHIPRAAVSSIVT